MSAPVAKKIDCHVHLVGNGKSGSGCWMRMTGWHRLMGEMMRRMIGMPVGVGHADFDEIYVQRLVASVRESSLDHAMLLAQDEVYHADGTKRDFGSFYVPNDYVFKICREHPEFLPAASIHPARKDALDELDRCLSMGARALKLLPNCHDVDCSDPHYDAFWQRMADAGLPLLAHTGGEMTVPVANPAYQDPETLRRPLEIGVKVIAAHCASNSSFWDRNYFPHLIGMMREFPNLYADTSALNTPVRSAALEHALDSEMPDRLVHGSDFPVPIGTWYALLRGMIDSDDRREAARIGNLLERDYFLKSRAGFAESHFTQIENVLRPWRVTASVIDSNEISSTASQ
jgi:predicted TIM-barrel fold metal-dependent hydrolase